MEPLSELLSRGVEKIYPSREVLEKVLGQKKIRLYLGIDPTGSRLHLGHTIPLRKLQEFANLGHEAILLIGTGTVLVGDPSQRAGAREQIGEDEIQKNIATWRKQAEKILDFSKVQIKQNGDWLLKLTMKDLIKISANISAVQLFKRDMFQERLQRGDTVWAHEILYPLLQGYDSVVLDADLEIGGTDQTFNMLIGRELMQKMRGKEKFVVSMKMLADSFGKKMGKTEGNRVSLDEKPSEMFGKIMSWPDGMILPAFELCTTVPLAEIAEVKKGLESGANPKTAKEKLAESIVSLYYGTKKAVKAREAFESTFSERKLPADIKEFKTEAGAVLSDCLLAAGIVASKGEWRRLVEEKAVSSVASNGGLEKILDVNFKISGPAVFKIGKHRFLKVVM